MTSALVTAGTYRGGRLQVTHGDQSVTLRSAANPSGGGESTQ